MKRTFSVSRSRPRAAVAASPGLAGRQRPRLFYGWYIVGVCFLAQMMSWGIMFYALTFFVRPMTADLGWTVAQFAVIYSLNSVLWGFFVPLFGGYVDRHGVRWPVVVGSLGTGLGLASVAYISNLWVFYLVLGVFVTITMALMAGFSSVAVSNWFVEKRGRTLAIMSMGSSMAGLTLAPLSAYLIGGFGWRIVWLVFGVIVIVTVTLPGLLLLKRRPEDVGLFPDGKDHPADQPVAGRVAERKILWTRGQAVRTATFWLLIVGFSLNYLVVGALLIHLAPFLGTKGLTSSQAAFGVFLLAMGALGIKPVVGILLEKIPPRYVASGSVWLSAVALVLLIVGESPLVIYAGILMYALSFGGSYPMEEMMWASSFGRWTLGRVRSLAFPFTVTLGSAGPVIGGIAYDATRSYIAVFTVFVVVLVASAIVLLFARPPKPAYVEEVVPPPPDWRRRALALLDEPHRRAAVPAFATVVAVAAFLSFFAATRGSHRHPQNKAS